jgi:pimeloyl-ACP methyl ester carboxylesterase
MPKTVVFIGGVSYDKERTNQLKAVIESFGYSFVAYEGWKTGEELSKKTIAQLLEELDALIEKHQAQYVLGKSLGGGLALLCKNPRIRSMVLWAPAFSFAEQSNLAEFLHKPFSQFKSTTEVKLGVTDLAGIRIPIRIMHGAKDDKIPMAHSRAFLPALPTADLVVIPGAGHSTHADIVAKQAVEWFGTHW